MKTLLLLSAALLSAPAFAQDVTTNETIKPQPPAAIPNAIATSPDGSIAVTIATDGDRLTLALAPGGGQAIRLKVR